MYFWNLKADWLSVPWKKQLFFFFFPSDFHTCSVRHKSNEAGVCLTVFQLWLVFLSPEICMILSFSSHLGFCFSALQAVSCKIDVKKVALEVFWGISCPQRKSAQTKQKEGSHLCINKVWLLVWKTSFLSVSYSYLAQVSEVWTYGRELYFWMRLTVEVSLHARDWEFWRCPYRSSCFTSQCLFYPNGSMCVTPLIYFLWRLVFDMHLPNIQCMKRPAKIQVDERRIIG